MKFKSALPDLLVAAIAVSVLPAVAVGLLAFFAILSFGWIVGSYWAILAGLILTFPFSLVYVFKQYSSLVEFDQDTFTTSYIIGQKREQMMTDIMEVRKKSLFGISTHIQVFTKDEKSFRFLIYPLNIRKLQDHLDKYRLTIF